MHFAFSADQEALRRSARQFLTEHSSSERVRKAMATEFGYDPEVWQTIAGDLGWPALIIPEAYGGVGGGHVDLAAIMEETGRFLLCAPLFSTVCLAANALLAGGTEEQKQEYLPPIAAGSLTGTVASLEADGASIKTSARIDGDTFVLNGTKSFVPDGATAGLLLVLARETDGAVSLFAVSGDSPGLARVARTTMDQTRRQADVILRDVRVPRSAVVGASGDGPRILERMAQRAIAALAAEQVGGAERCLEMAVDYAKTRVQFNRPIGSFQAIKHKCADMMLLIESARSAALYAGWAADEDPDDLASAASTAKVYCSDAYFQCASENIQIHGGIGFTWEHDAHLYFKRAQSTSMLLGDAAFHREACAREILDR